MNEDAYLKSESDFQQAKSRGEIESLKDLVNVMQGKISTLEDAVKNLKEAGIDCGPGLTASGSPEEGWSLNLILQATVECNGDGTATVRFN